MSWWKGLPIFVLNMEQSLDRWDRWAPFSDVERIEGIKGSQINIAQDPRVSLRARISIVEKQVRTDHNQINSPGAVGCALSHAKAWQMILDRGYPAAWIFEDDTRVPEEAYRFERFGDYLDSLLEQSKESMPTELDQFDVLVMGICDVEDYDVLILNPKPLEHDMQATGKLTRGLVRVRSPFTSLHASIWTSYGAQYALNHVFPLEGHVDHMLGLLSRFEDFVVVCPTDVPIFPNRIESSLIIHTDVVDVSSSRKKLIVSCLILLLAIIAVIYLAHKSKSKPCSISDWHI